MKSKHLNEKSPPQNLQYSISEILKPFKNKIFQANKMIKALYMER